MDSGVELARFLLAYGRGVLDIFEDREGRKYIYTEDMKRIYLPEELQAKHKIT